MEMVNPTQNAPMLAPPSPTKRYAHSRSPSTSPTRPYSALGFDPLLRCLSPTSTLQAFTTSAPTFRGSRSPSPRRLTLDASIKNVSEEQKELGIKAAQACLDIRGWTYELEGWEWPGCFDVPEPARKRARHSVMSIGSLASRQTIEDEEKEEFWGSLPAVVVEEYDERLQQISMQLDAIDLEDLKNYTLQAHTSPDTTPRLQQTGDDTDVLPDLRQLDDFTAVVTATILQTLPFVNRLARLLDDWSARITVLKAIPAFLRDLDRLRTDLDHGWAAVAVSLRKNGMFASLGSDNMQEMQSLIDSSMASLGRRLDEFLDLLEGRQDTVPDLFLDKFEELEERYAEWVVTAQRRVLGDELKEYQPDPSTPTTIQLNGRESIDRTKTPTPHNHRVIETGRDSTIEPWERGRTPTLLPGFELVERARTPTFLSTSDVVERAITPTIRDAASATASTPDEIDWTRETNKSRILQDYEEPVEQALYEPPVSAVPQILIDQQPNLTTSAPQPVEEQDILPSRQAPIILPVDGNGSSHHISPAVSATSLPAQQEIDKSTVGSTVQDRERPSITPSPVTISSQKQPKSPVRTASNALARLFKREKKQDAGIERSDSTASTSSGGFFSSRKSVSRRKSTRTGDATILGGQSGSTQRPASATARNIAELPAQTERHSLEIEHNRLRAHDDTLKILQQPAEAISTQSERPRTAVAATRDSRPQSSLFKRLSRLSTATKEPEFPENWPLTPSMRASALYGPVELPANDVRDSVASGMSSDPDLRTVRSMAAIGSDDFDKAFIDEFPSVPNEHGQSALITFDEDDTQSDSGTELGQERTPEDRWVEEPSVLTATPPSTRKIPVPIVTSSMLSSNGRQDDMSVARAISIEGLKQFNNPPPLPEHQYQERHANILRDDRSSSLPLPYSLSDEETLPPDDLLILGQRSRPSGQGPAAIAALAAARNTSSQHDESRVQHDTTNYAALAAAQAMVTHAELPSHTPTQPALPKDDEPAAEDGGSPLDSKIVKRASTASIKAHLASEIRSIDVPARRRESIKPDESSGLSTPVFESAPDSRRDSSSYVQRPAFSRAGSRSGAQSPTSSIDTPNFSRLRSSSVDTNDQRVPPLNSAISKKRRAAPALETIQPSAEYDADTAASSLPKAKRAVAVDEIDRHVREVLEKIPAPIRFRARGADDSGASSPGPRVSEVKSGHLRPRQALTPRQSSGSGALSLTPAEATPRKSSSNNESGIKMYHLTQAGREDPIKLFIRLVGENDRVMVRVGGGWADLADYLKQYAEHHVSRTVSGSGFGFELQSAGTTPAGSRSASGAVITASEPSAAKDREVSTASPAGTASMTPHDVSTPTIEGRAELPGSDVEATLLSVNSKLQSRPSTALGRAKSALSARSSNADLRKQKTDEATSEHKAKWVKTMLEKARKETSGAKSRKGGNAFGDIGRIGSTRRVIFRSSSAADNTKSK